MALELLDKISIFSFADRYDAAIDASKRACQRRHDMAAAMTALHRVDVDLDLDGFILGILLE